jgi:hypothetical protein
MAKYKSFEEWVNLANGMESYLLSASDEEILRENPEAGLDADAIALSLRSSMLKTVNKFRRRRLEFAQNSLMKAPESPRLPASVYSATPQQRLALLRSTLQKQPGMTAQFRQLETMTDEDVLSALEDLALLQKLSNNPEGKES